MGKYSRRFSLAAVIIALVAACRAPNTVGELATESRPLRVRDCKGPATSLAPELAAALAPRSGNMHPDDQWADMAATVPGGFAGVMYSGGKPILLLTRPDEAAAAKAALAPLIPSFPIKDADVWAVRWDFAQLVDWYNYFIQRTRLWSLNVTLGAKSEGDNRVKFGIADSTNLFRARDLLDSLAIPCDLVLLEIATPIQPLTR